METIHHLGPKILGPSHHTFGESEVGISKLYCISTNEHYIYFKKTRILWCTYVFCGSISSWSTLFAKVSVHEFLSMRVYGIYTRTSCKQPFEISARNR